MITPRRIILAALTLLVLFTAQAAAGAGGELISFGTTTCAPGWSAPNPGVAHFQLANRSARSATVYLFHADSGAIAATVAHISPGATRGLTVKLSGGAYYAWSCDLDGYPVHISDTQQVPVVAQAGGSGPKVVPIQADQLVAPLQSYRGYVSRQLATLRAQLATLAGDLSPGASGGSGASDATAQAEADWLSAHLTWLAIGQDDGAYGAFGALGQQIDGMASAYVLGTSSPRFSGFHRVELDLFADHDLSAAATDTAKLQALVAEITPQLLVADMPTSAAGLSTFTLRVHEVLEDAMRDSLTGDDNYGSGSDAASLTADVTAVREFLALLAPLLAPRSPYLVGRAGRQLSTLLTAAEAADTGAGWEPIQTLPTRLREQIDADTGAVLETLAPIPDILALGGT